MGNNKIEPKLTYAIDAETGKMVYIGSVKRGRSCNCLCPKCNEVLVAKLGWEGGRQAHFAHAKGTDCQGAYMTTLHKLAIQIIEEKKSVMFPAYKEINQQKIFFKEVEVEQRTDRKDLQPDIVGITADKLRWSIEIRNTHEVNLAKTEKLKESQITCLEIDVRNQKLENLETFILESTEDRKWINNPNYDFKIAEEKRRKVSLVEEIVRCNNEISIPEYNKDTQITIHYKEISVLSRSADGLFIKIKIVSIEGAPYVINIGCNDVLQNEDSEKDCDELSIYTDNLPLTDNTTIDSLCVKWAYHYTTEKQKEDKLREYRSNTRYNVKPKSDICFNCKYSKNHSKCIYRKETINYKDIEYAVCNTYKKLEDENYTSSRNNVNFYYNNKQSWSEDNLEYNNIEEDQDSLPFERYWTIDEFHSKLLDSKQCQTESGQVAGIVKCDKVGNKVLILCYVKSCSYPLHIMVGLVEEGNLTIKNVGDFLNIKEAFKTYNERLSIMKKHWLQSPVNDKDVAPF